MQSFNQFFQPQHLLYGQFPPINDLFEQFKNVIALTQMNMLQNLNSYDALTRSDASNRNQDSPLNTEIYSQDRETKDFQKTKKVLKQQKQQKNCQNNYCQNKRKCLHEVSVSDKKLNLCNKCHDNFSQNNYCEYCIQIYDPTLGYEIDEKQWIMCESCERWNHVECEQIHGKYILNKITNQTKYRCTKCREYKKKLGRPKKDTTQEQELQNSKYNKPTTIIKLTNKEIMDDLTLLKSLCTVKKVKLESCQ